MLYPFPPPDWFETGSTSLPILIIILWGIVIGLPGSALFFWIFLPRSRWMWILAESFWAVLSFASVLAFFSSTQFSFLNDVPSYLSLPAVVLMMLIPIPAAVAGSAVLRDQTLNLDAFRSIPPWGCLMTTIVLFYLIAFPALITPREVSRRSECKNSLKQIGLAFHNYLDTYEHFADSQTNGEGVPPHSWRVTLLPYLDHQTEFEAYNQTENWNSNNNYKLALLRLREFTCPSVRPAYAQDSDARWLTAYATLNSPQSAFPGGKGRSIKEFPDWTSHTVLVVEACGQQIVWTEPRDIELTDKNLGINLPGNKPGQSSGSWSSYHRDGAQTLMADGSVRFMSVTTDPKVLRAITTANGGEEVGSY